MMYGGAWVSNPGNGFIHLGCQALLREALPDARIQAASCLPRWLFSQGGVDEPARGLGASLVHAARAGLEGLLQRPEEAPRYPYLAHAVDMTEELDYDLLVIYGMALSASYIRTRGPAVKRAAKRGVRILLIGVGGRDYTPAERAVVARFLADIEPLLFIARDQPTMDAYGGCARRALAGLDNGFFVPSAFEPLRFRRRCVARTFDSMPDPEENPGPEVIHCRHIVRWPLPKAVAARPRTLISDLPHDYLSVYANAAETHSDRVHACVAALAYGKPARFYGQTPRRQLFAPAGVAGLATELAYADPRAIARRRAAMAAALQDAVRAA